MKTNNNKGVNIPKVINTYKITSTTGEMVTWDMEAVRGLNPIYLGDKNSLLISLCNTLGGVVMPVKYGQKYKIK